MAECPHEVVSNLRVQVARKFGGRHAPHCSGLPPSVDDSDVLDEVLLRQWVRAPERVRAWCDAGVLTWDAARGELLVTDPDAWREIAQACRGRRSEVRRIVQRRPAESALFATTTEGDASELPFEGHEGAPDADVERREEIEHLLRTLNDIEQQVIRCRLSGLTLRETAGRLEMPLGTAQSHEFRARRKLCASAQPT